MTITASKLFSLAALVIFVLVAAVAYLTDTPDLAHLIGGLCIGLAVLAAAALVP